MNSLVQIHNGYYRGAAINGVFEFRGYEKTQWGVLIHTILDNEEADILVNTSTGSVQQIQVGSTLQPQLDTTLSEQEIEELIKERFEVMLDLIRTLRISDVNALTIMGATGIGKTWNATEELEKAEREEGQYWNSLGGKCTAFGLYEALYENRYPGSILLLDDVDVFQDEDMLNIFKKALDTSKRRIVDWRSASRLLDERGIPDSFEFEGKIIFLTNTNMLDEIKRSTKRAPHLKAVLGRGIALDLGIHDIGTIFIYIRMLIRKNNYLMNRGLTQEQQEMVLDFLSKHRDSLTSLSLRTPLIIAEFMKVNFSTWERNAMHTLLAPIALN